MADNTFIKVLNILVKKTTLTNEEANQVIDEYFPEKEYNDGNETKSKLRKLTEYKMKEVKKHNLEKVFKLLNKVYPKLYLNQTTLDNFFSRDIRKQISTRFGLNSPEHKKSKKLVALSYEDKGRILQEQNDKVLRKRENPEEIDPKNTLNIIQEYQNSDNVFQVLLTLALASGSRPIELVLRSDYYRENDSWILQNKIAKKRGEEFEVVKPVVGMSADTFLSKLKNARLDLKKKYGSLNNTNNVNNELNPSISQKFNITAKKIFQKGYTAYTSRALYAVISYELFQKNKTTYLGANSKEDVWITKILGHEQGSSAFKNYSRFFVKKDDDCCNEVEAKIDDLEVKIDTLQKRVDEENIPKLSNKGPSLTELQKNKLKEIFDEYNELNPKKRMPAYLLEARGKDIASRALIRAYYKELKYE